MIWLILLADYRTFRIYVIFLFIKCIFVAEILTCDAVDFLAYSLVTADQGCSTEMVNYDGIMLFTVSTDYLYATITCLYIDDYLDYPNTAVLQTIINGFKGSKTMTYLTLSSCTKTLIQKKKVTG